MLSFCRAITCPVLVFVADNDHRRKQWSKPGSFHRERFASTCCCFACESSNLTGLWLTFQLHADRVAALSDVALERVEASHHLHLDAAHEIYRTVIDFLIDPSLLKSRRVAAPPSSASKTHIAPETTAAVMPSVPVKSKL